MCLVRHFNSMELFLTDPIKATVCYVSHHTLTELYISHRPLGGNAVLHRLTPHVRATQRIWDCYILLSDSVSSIYLSSGFLFISLTSSRITTPIHLVRCLPIRGRRVYSYPRVYCTRHTVMGWVRSCETDVVW